jgi:hypothetical protein
LQAQASVDFVQLQLLAKTSLKYFLKILRWIRVSWKQAKHTKYVTAVCIEPSKARDDSSDCAGFARREEERE